MLKIVFTGPESTGKSTLAKLVANKYGVDFVPEVARAYLNSIGRPYSYDDLEQIAINQLEKENYFFSKKPDLFILDTDILTIKIWSDFKYKQHALWMDQEILNRLPNIYFLCGVDCPWDWDPLREHPSQRIELFNIYKRELEELGVNTVLLKGPVFERINQISSVLDNCL